MSLSDLRCVFTHQTSLMQNSNLFGHTWHLCVYVQSSTTQPTCLYNRPSHLTWPCFYSRPKSLNATLHLTSSWLPINMILMFWRHPKSWEFFGHHSLLGQAIENESITSWLPINMILILFITSGHYENPSIRVLIKALALRCPCHVIYGSCIG